MLMRLQLKLFQCIASGMCGRLK